MKKSGKKSPFIFAAFLLKDAADSAAEEQAEAAVQAFSECLHDIFQWLDGVFVEHGDVRGIWAILLALEKAHKLGQRKILECEHRLKMVDEEYEKEEENSQRLKSNAADRERNAKKARLAKLELA